MNPGEALHSPAAIDAAATELGRRLSALGVRVATAESCTGGLIARALTEAPGSSQWFDRGFVTYSNASKTQLLGVQADAIARDGAVSEAVARAMALGALERSEAGLALSVTGVAGPSGGSEAKPVGTVCFGWIRAGGEPLGATVRFAGDRAAVRSQAALHALRGALAVLSGHPLPEPTADPKD